VTFESGSKLLYLDKSLFRDSLSPPLLIMDPSKRVQLKCAEFCRLVSSPNFHWMWFPVCCFFITLVFSLYRLFR
jgi:hypothetical protein